MDELVWQDTHLVIDMENIDPKELENVQRWNKENIFAVKYSSYGYSQFIQIEHM
jgi:hypothetical protein